MNHLIIGIDGGDDKVYDIFDMPFLSSLKTKSEAIQLTEDLHSRGWVEMISGDHASFNNGFYLRPLCNGTTEFTLSYSFSDLKNNKTKPLIWEMAQQYKYKVGIMNVPTTYPAPDKVNGFFVSGAGGGLTKVEGIPSEMCSDEDIRDSLQQRDYILDLRLKPSGITDKHLLFEKLTEMMVTRTDAFIDFSNERNVDFGFLAYRAPTVVTYLAMYEIERFKNGETTSEWEKLLVNFFETLDNQLRKVFDQLSPDSYILTADHGVTHQKYHSNFNKFLNDAGLLELDYKFSEHLIYIAKNIRNVIGSLFGKTFPRPKFMKIDFQKTQIFGNYYYNGLYVNDERRFGGPVKQEDIRDLVDKTCERFNNYQEAQKHKMKARPYRQEFIDRPYSDQLPDIWIDAPDEYYFLPSGRDFVHSNPFYKPIKDIGEARSSMHTGIKGSHPICYLSSDLGAFVEEDDDKDLTLIHTITKRYLER